MNWNITHDADRNYVHAYQGGRYNLDDEASFLNAIFSSPFWQKGTPLVVDICSMEMDNVDDSVITVASRMVVLLNEKLGKTRFALVCDDDRKLEVGRKWQSSVAPNLDAEVQVFSDEAAAIEWATGSTDAKASA